MTTILAQAQKTQARRVGLETEAHKGASFKAGDF
jgi:hypothetical protein